MTGLSAQEVWTAYRLRLKRRRLLWRAFRSRRQLRSVQDRVAAIGPGTILVASVVRNEIIRLPWFLDHYRRLGVGHFLIVDNDSSDGTTGFLQAQPDVSVWQTADSYKQARFGVDWLTWLQICHAHGPLVPCGRCRRTVHLSALGHPRSAGADGLAGPQWDRGLSGHDA